MTRQPRKMSEILKEMSERLLRNTHAVRSAEAAQMAMVFASIAWNETVGLVHPRKSYRSAWETTEAENPQVWSEFKLNDADSMIDELVRFKKQLNPDDQRRILSCGMMDGRVRVEWLPPAAPGVDSKWEMRLYGLVRTGEREKAIQFLQETRHMPGHEAARRVAQVAFELGIPRNHIARGPGIRG